MAHIGRKVQTVKKGLQQGPLPDMIGTVESAYEYEIEYRYNVSKILILEPPSDWPACNSKVQRCLGT